MLSYLNSFFFHEMKARGTIFIARTATARNGASMSFVLQEKSNFFS